jgi:transposase
MARWLVHQEQWGMSNFREVDRQTGFLLPPSVDEWLPGQHLARFVVEVVESLDLRAMTGDYRGSGLASYHPAVLLGILVYGYASGVFSSRKLERATYDSVALRFVAANQHPDHDTIATPEPVEGPTALSEADRRPVCAGAVAGA